jgi:hypothetical protein
VPSYRGGIEHNPLLEFVALKVEKQFPLQSVRISTRVLNRSQVRRCKQFLSAQAGPRKVVSKLLLLQ